jgi:hypothetical protein
MRSLQLSGELFNVKFLLFYFFKNHFGLSGSGSGFRSLTDLTDLAPIRIRQNNVYYLVVAVLLKNVPAEVPHRKETVAQLTLNLNKLTI